MLHEITLHLFGFYVPLYGYGLMLVVAFAGCVLTGRWLARRSGLNPDLVIDAALIALITGMIGARLSHVLENLGEFTKPDRTILQNLGNVLNFRAGGLTYYGGFLLATPCCLLYAYLRRVPILLGMDIVAPVLMVGLGFGRIGCFLNGCCYGEQCTTLGIAFPHNSPAWIDQVDHKQLLASAAWSNPVLPTQLYSAWTAFLLAGVLIAYFTLKHPDGRVFALMLILEGIARFVLELIRVEPVVWPHAGAASRFSLSMILGQLNVVAGAVMWWLVRGRAVNVTGPPAGIAGTRPPEPSRR